MFEELKVWIDTVRNEEVKGMQDKLNLILNKTSVTGRKSTFGSAASAKELEESTLDRNESNFSFNYKAQRSLLYEEIEMLRDQVSQFMDSYTRATISRDAQYQIFAKERNLLLQREDQLQQALTDVIELAQVLEEQQESRENIMQQNEYKQVEELQE